MSLILAVLLMAGQVQPVASPELWPALSESSPWAYTLEDPYEPEYLALRTQVGTFRVWRFDDWQCGYLLANQNVEVVTWESSIFVEPWATVAIPNQDGWELLCRIALVSYVDRTPCFVNEWGDCDVRIENAY